MSFYKANGDGTFARIPTIPQDLPEDIETEFSDFKEMDDSLFELCFDGYRLKGSTEGRDEAFLKRQARENAIPKYYELMKYLASTDWIVTKLAEMKVTDDTEYEETKKQYSATLTKRAEVRSELSVLVDTYPELKN